jgi:hypothetical protein
MRPRFAGTTQNQDRPEDTVYRALGCAREGDVKGYLDCFTGQLRDQLDTSVDDAGADRFADELQARTAPVTGIVVAAPGTTPPDAERTVLSVELVYRKRNETQQYTLVRTHRARWLIEDIGVARTVTMPIPYGTPIVPEDPNAPAPPPE